MKRINMETNEMYYLNTSSMLCVLSLQKTNIFYSKMWVV